MWGESENRTPNSKIDRRIVRSFLIEKDQQAKRLEFLVRPLSVGASEGFSHQKHEKNFEADNDQKTIKRLAQFQ